MHFGTDPDADPYLWLMNPDANPYLWLIDPDTDPDPAILYSDLQDVNRKKKFFYLLLFEGTFTSFFKDNNS